MAENFWLEVIKGMDRGSQEYKSMYQAASKKHRERLEKEVGPPIVEKNKGSGVETVDTGVTKTAGEPPPPPGGSGRRGGMELVRPDNLPPPARGGAVNRDDESRLETRGGMPSGGYSQRLMGPQEQMTQGDVSGGQSRVRPRAGSTDQSGSGGALNVRPQGPGAMEGLRGFSNQTNPASRTTSASQIGAGIRQGMIDSARTSGRRITDAQGNLVTRQGAAPAPGSSRPAAPVRGHMFRQGADIDVVGARSGLTANAPPVQTGGNLDPSTARQIGDRAEQMKDEAMRGGGMQGAQGGGNVQADIAEIKSILKQLMGGGGMSMGKGNPAATVGAGQRIGAFR